PSAVHLRNDERDAVLEPERRGLVDADRAAANRVRHELSARLSPDGEEAEVEIPGRERFGCRLLDDELAEPRARGAGRGERAHVPVAALGEELERDRADGAGRPDNADAGITHAGARPP